MPGIRCRQPTTDPHSVTDSARRDFGSFRDPSGHVMVDEDRIIRVLDDSGLAAWRALEKTRFFDGFTTDGRLVATREIDAVEAGIEGWSGVLEHDRIPVISYPYEWSFSMLQDAALLTLDLTEAAINEDLIMKDATPYNIQWRGTRPSFIDIGSFEPLAAGEAWPGYRQFCRQFLFPLMLQAYKDIPFQPWLRGRLDGLAAAEFRRMLRPRDLLRRGVPLHVALQARAERRYEHRSRNVRSEIRQAGFRKEMILNNVRNLRKLVAGLRWDRESSQWSEYSTQDHAMRHREAKADFLRRNLAGTGLVWDLGANDGYYSRIAAEGNRAVLAVDGDALVIDRLYRSLSAEANQSILPLVVDLSDPSPATGWRQRERTALGERARPDLVVMYAVIHHMVIGGNIPTHEVLDWLAELDTRVVIEFVPVGDPMTDLLLANKRSSDVHRDYDEATFRQQLSERFEIEDEREVPDSSRTLLALRPRR